MSKKNRSFTKSFSIPEGQIDEQTNEQLPHQVPQVDDETWNEHTEDVKVGELDTLIEQAIADFLAGRYEEV